MVAAVERGTLWGTQFHPEKSSRTGLGASRELREGRCGRPVSAPFDLYCAVDILEGGAVRLTKGEFGIRTEHGDPVALALRYVRQGARMLHVVDLDAARADSL